MSILRRMIEGRLARAAAVAGVALVSLSACTTLEGTNAFTDGATFEREVLRSTLQGIGVVPAEPGPTNTQTQRAPLVVPGSGAVPPPPQQAATAALPANSDQVVLDRSGLTDADLAFLRDGRVVDVNQVQGRPLTETEARQLAARMAAYRQAQGQGERSIYLPPEAYFNRVGGQQLICLASNGTLVPLNDPTCPPEVRAQLLAAQR